MNLRRSVWELRRSNDDNDGDLQVALYHRKTNRGRLHPPIALAFAYEPDSLTVHGARLGESPDLRARASLPVQIRTALMNGAKTIPALAAELDAKEDTVKKTVHRLRDRRVVQILGDKQPHLWGLATQ